MSNGPRRATPDEIGRLLTKTENSMRAENEKLRAQLTDAIGREANYERDNRELRQKLDQLRAALEAVEWAGIDGACPFCDAHPSDPRKPPKSHWMICDIGQALAVKP